jgi:hypothetical protein
MCHEDRLAGLDDDYAFPSLHNILALPHPSNYYKPPSTHFVRGMSYLLPINTPIIRLEHHIPLTRDMQPRTLHLLHAIGTLVLIRGHYFLHFLRRDSEAGAGGPDGVAFAVEDCCAVDVARAYEAGRSQSVGRDELGEIECVPGVYVGCEWILVRVLEG